MALVAVWIASGVEANAAAAPAAPATGASATWNIAGAPLRLTAGAGFAGAVSSIVYRGREYLNDADHGRELQGAVQFGAGECFNPTLAGSRTDPPGRSTSVLLQQAIGPSGYRSTTRMAFWTPVGGRCRLASGRMGHALNASPVSDLVYAQAMTPGAFGHANAVLDHVTITAGQEHPPAAVELLTGYMPPAFDTFMVYRPFEDRFEADPALAAPSSEGDGAVLVSTADGSAAMGVVAVGGEGRVRYAAFRDTRVSKWSLLYRTSVPFRAGPHAYTAVWAIGTRKEVAATLADILKRQERVGVPTGWLGVMLGLLVLAIAGVGIASRRRSRGGRLDRLGR